MTNNVSENSFIYFRVLTKDYDNLPVVLGGYDNVFIFPDFSSQDEKSFIYSKANILKLIDPFSEFTNPEFTTEYQILQKHGRIYFNNMIIEGLTEDLFNGIKQIEPFHITESNFHLWYIFSQNIRGCFDKDLVEKLNSFFRKAKEWNEDVKNKFISFKDIGKLKHTYEELKNFPSFLSLYNQRLAFNLNGMMYNGFISRTSSDCDGNFEFSLNSKGYDAIMDLKMVEQIFVRTSQFIKED